MRPRGPLWRIGEGWDTHALVEGRKLILGGVEIAHTHGLLGHSDADALCHAITDALFGAAALGDIGHLDEDGFLYLTDRKSYMIISGGVNIYPQETEDVLITHPAVSDVAVFGVPNEEMGEEVKAVVQPHDMAKAGKELEDASKANGFTFPADTDAKHQEMLDKLSALKGAEFDKAYIGDMVAGS